MVEKYKKGVYLAPLIRKLEDADISSMKLKPPTETGNKVPTEIAKKIYELELKNTWIEQIFWKII